MPKTTPCVITFYKNNEPNCTVTTGDLTVTEIMDVLKTLLSGFARQVVKEAIKTLGTDDPKALEEYLDTQLKLDRKSIDDILNS